MTKDKFTLIYSFKIKEGKEAEFIKSWADLTHLIYEFSGSYGSRLHKASDNLFIAYAQWPDKETWNNSKDKLPEAANQYSQSLRECCLEVKVEYELEVINDLLQDDIFQSSSE